MGTIFKEGGNMNIEKAREIANKMHEYETRRDRFILQLGDLRLVKSYEWCEREAARVPYLTPRERELYVKALFSAVRWAKQH